MSRHGLTFTDLLLQHAAAYHAGLKEEKHLNGLEDFKSVENPVT